MKMKKILSAIIAAALATSTFTAFASNPADLPQYHAYELEGEALTVTVGRPEDGVTETLDFGMAFEAVEETNEKYGNFGVDFELEFDKDVKVIPAGQYKAYTEATGNEWILLGDAESPIEFKANEPVRLMKDYVIPGFMGEEAIEGQMFTYDMVMTWVKAFQCGIKLVDTDFSDGVTATLKLCLYQTEEKAEDAFVEVKDGIKYVLGDIVEYTYGIVASDTDEDKAAKIEDAEITEENVEQIKEVIKELDSEVKEGLSAETVKELVEAANPTADTTQQGAYSVDPTLTLVVNESTSEEAAFANAVVYDVSVYENHGTEEEIEHTTVDVPVLVAIPLAPGQEVERVLHNHNGVIEELNFFVDDVNNILYFQMSKFSNIGIEFKASALVPGTAKLSLVEVSDTDARYVEGKAKYDIKLIGADNATIKNFVSGEFTVTVNTDANYSYAIEENYPDETSIWIVSEDIAAKTRNYAVKLDGFDEKNSWTAKAKGTEITLGTLTLTAVGEGSIALSNVEAYRHDASKENQAALITKVAGAPVLFDIKIPTREVTFNVEFVNSIEKTDSFYTEMKIELAGTVNKTWALGNDVEGVKFDINTCTYTVTEDLPLGEYAVTVSGAGYRTVNYNFEVTDNMTLDFWNNVKEGTAKKEITKGSGEVETTFLAGDIVNDNFIDMNDLSAAVSYFGYDKTQKTDLAQYDLNRDGKVNSKDVAYVLVSWNK